MFNKNNQIVHILNKICDTFKLGQLIDYKISTFHNHPIYEVITNSNKYYIIEYTKKDIPNQNKINYIKQQISIMKKLSTNGVPIILPLNFNDKNIIKYRQKYYLVYDYQEYTIKDFASLDTKTIKKLAHTLAIIHKLSIKSSLSNNYEELTINLPKLLKKCQKIDSTLYNNFYNNYFLLEDLIKKVNENLKYLNNTLYINYNNYYLDNILWQKDYMYLANFESITLSNPLVSLADCAFYYSQNNNQINEEFYITFIKSYLKKYGPLKNDYKTALYVAPINALKKLNNLLLNTTKTDKENILLINNIINILSLYYNNIERFNQLSILAVKKH